MSDTEYDVAIVGGGPAGLSAAIWLGRYLHSVALIDSGDPRNWETQGINGYLGLPGIRPAQLRGAGRDEARRYGIALVDGCVTAARKEHDDRWWIVDADITLALHHRDGEPLDGAQVRAIALHEIGHLLGLDHTGDQTNVLAARVRVRDLSLADRATVRLLYSVPAGKITD